MAGPEPRAERSCEVCGSALDAGDRFCGECGYEAQEAQLDPSTGVARALPRLPGSDPDVEPDPRPSAAGPAATVTVQRVSQRKRPLLVPEQVAIAPDPSAFDHASWGVRVGARLIDWCLLTVVFLASVAAAAGIAYAIAGETAAALTGLFAFVGLGYLEVALYYLAGDAGQTGQTLGRRMFGIRVVRTDGAPLGFWHALGRQFLAILSAIPFMLGYLAPLWDPQRRTWHDSLAGTVVIHDKTKKGSGLALGTLMITTLLLVGGFVALGAATGRLDTTDYEYADSSYEEGYEEDYSSPGYDPSTGYENDSSEYGSSSNSGNSSSSSQCDDTFDSAYWPPTTYGPVVQCPATPGGGPSMSQTSVPSGSWINVLDSIPVLEVARVDSRAGQFRNSGYDVELLDSRNYSSLRDPYWVLYVGPFSTKDQASNWCTSQPSPPGDCYPREVR